MRSQLTRLWAVASFIPQILSVSLSPSAAAVVNQNAVNNGKLNTEGTETLDGVPIDSIPGIPTSDTAEGRSAVAQNAVVIPAGVMSTWTASADTYQNGNPPSNAIDGNANTFWHSEYSPVLTALPHYLVIDMKKNYLVNSLSYQPRQDGGSNGNIGGHTITFSTDGVNFGQPKCIGTWLDDSSTKTSAFEATNARYVKLTALTEAGARGPWTSVAEIQIYTTTTPAPAYNGVGGGEWSPTIDFPLVPVSVALEYNQGPGTGTILAWSSFSASTFFGTGESGQTVTASFDPASQTVSQRTVTNTGHDMFCEGLALDTFGRIISTGGNSASLTSIFTPSAQAWSSAPNMNIARGYHSQVTCNDGRIFTIGGSWSGGEGGKNGEIYNPFTNQWSLLSQCPVAPMLTQDAQGIYRADNHAWLFAWKNGWVLQAGPSKQMNYYQTWNSGWSQPAGNRGDDGDAMCGNAVMYDAIAGKILTIGGATSYQGVNATANAHVLTVNDNQVNPTVQTINQMNYQRIFANAVVMPDGNVFIVGGQVYGQPFSDDTSIMVPEVWASSTGHFNKVAPQAVPRNYHSTAILLADATIFSGGGGLCGSCSTNHYDGQVYTPGYLFNSDGSRATRPTITSVNGGNTAQIKVGGTLTVVTGGGVGHWAMVRVSSTTHTVNTDQRRIPIYTFTNNGNTFTLNTPTDSGILIPGAYMLFALSNNYVPSVAKYIIVTN